MTPAQIIDEVSRANLRGLGGAGFRPRKSGPSFPKASPKPKYLVVNADEGSPARSRTDTSSSAIRMRCSKA